MTSIKNTKRISSIIENLKRLRSERKFNQTVMAAKLGMSQNAYSKIELGYTDLTLERMFELADIFDVSIVDLLEPAA